MSIKALNNKTAFITGAASGIGLGMAKAFAERGMNVVLADISAKLLESVTQELVDQGVNAIAIPLDITDRDALKAAVVTVEQKFGAVHLVCANAGVTGFMGPIEDAKDEDWEWAIDVNLKGTVNTIQAFLPLLLKNDNDGHIVLTSSISGLRVYQPSRGQGMYNTTKYALVGLGEALSADLERHGVGVSILCPGVVNTEFSHAGRNRPEKYGGAFETGLSNNLAKLAGSGTDPVEFGRWVVKAIEGNKLYAITHPVDRNMLSERHDKIMQAFDDSEQLKS